MLKFHKKQKLASGLFLLSFACLIGAIILRTIMIPFATTREVYFLMKNLLCGLMMVAVVSVIILFWKQLHFLTKLLLVLFPVIDFMGLHLFPVRVDYMLYQGHLALCFLCCFISVIYWLAKKEKSYLWNGIILLIYSAILNFIKAFELEERVITQADDLMGKMLIGACVCGAVFVIIYVILRKDRTDKKEYFGAMFGCFFAVVACAVMIPFFCVQTINYTFDSSIGTDMVYTITDKDIDYNRKASDDYCLIVTKDGEELEIEVSGFIYYKLDINDQITLYQHDGFLGLPYYEYGTEDYI